jgi:ubiquinone/menaquinone biosynthesis C-methylase UbiE
MSADYKKTYWKKILFLDSFLLKILKYNRLKIQQIFEKNIKFKKLLDVGTTPIFDEFNNILLHSFKNRNNITSLSNLNCSVLKKKFKKVKFIKGDARRMKFKENSFDTVYSSATIEHVGSRINQLKFIKECYRVSRKNVFITTPNKFYPIEFHTKIPLLHFFPSKIYRKILFYLGFSFFSKEKNLNLVSVKDLKNMCFFLKIKDFNIIKYKFLFMTSNLILHIKK